MTSPHDLKAYGAPRRRITEGSWGKLLAIALVIAAGATSLWWWIGSLNPIDASGEFGPGIAITEMLDDGLAQNKKDPLNAIFGVPRYVARVSPGQQYSYYLTVANVLDVPIRITGVPSPATRQGQDPAPDSIAGLYTFVGAPHAGAGLAELSPFAPTQLDPGGRLTIAILWRAGDCATPDGVVEPRTSPPETYSLHGLTFLYSVLGLERSATVWPPFEVAVASRAGCNPAP